MERNNFNSSILEIFIFINKKNLSFLLKSYCQSLIYIYAKPFIHFQGGGGGVLICINKSFSFIRPFQ